jgi:hypothetical protein
MELTNEQVDEQLTEVDDSYRYMTLFTKKEMREAYRAGHKDGMNDGKFEYFI